MCTTVNRVFVAVKNMLADTKGTLEPTNSTVLFSPSKDTAGDKQQRHNKGDTAANINC